MELKKTAMVAATRVHDNVAFDVSDMDSMGRCLIVVKQNHFLDEATIDEGVLILIEAFVQAQRKMKEEVASGELDPSNVLGPNECDGDCDNCATIHD